MESMSLSERLTLFTLGWINVQDGPLPFRLYRLGRRPMEFVAGFDSLEALIDYVGHLEGR
jgi:hypothetical protein